jgi:DNA-binding response OmpR family regulator
VSEAKHLAHAFFLLLAFLPKTSERRPKSHFTKTYKEEGFEQVSGGTMSKILVIEDDDVARELMQMALQARGHEVSVADNGVAGYDAALFLKPELIVTDIQMPGADGVHVVRRVRDTPSLERTPILVTTAFGTGTATFALQLGADAYEPKPLNPQSFLATVERLLVNQNTKKAA